jgi:hypothetical protein
MADAHRLAPDLEAFLLVNDGLSHGEHGSRNCRQNRHIIAFAVFQKKPVISSSHSDHNRLNGSEVHKPFERKLEKRFGKKIAKSCANLSCPSA